MEVDRNAERSDSFILGGSLWYPSEAVGGDAFPPLKDTGFKGNRDPVSRTAWIATGTVARAPSLLT